MLLLIGQWHEPSQPVCMEGSMLITVPARISVGAVKVDTDRLIACFCTWECQNLKQAFKTLSAYCVCGIRMVCSGWCIRLLALFSEDSELLLRILACVCVSDHCMRNCTMFDLTISETYSWPLFSCTERKKIHPTRWKATMFLHCEGGESKAWVQKTVCCFCAQEQTH